MVTISFTKLRQNAKTYFDAVERGEVVRVLRHGKVVAKIIPPSAKESMFKKEGLKLVVPGVSLSEAILKERKEA